MTDTVEDVLLALEDVASGSRSLKLAILDWGEPKGPDFDNLIFVSIEDSFYLFGYLFYQRLSAANLGVEFGLTTT